MTKQELLQAFDNAIDTIESRAVSRIGTDDIKQAEKDRRDEIEFLRQIRRDIDNLLKFVDNATELSSLTTLSQCKDSKSLEDFLKTSSFAAVQCQALKMQGNLETFAVESGKNNALQYKVNSCKQGWRQRKRAVKIVCTIVFCLLGVASIVASILAIIEVRRGDNGMIGGIIGAIGFSVDVIAFVVERAMDLYATDKMEKSAQAALEHGEDGVKQFECRYNIGKQVNKHVGQVINGDVNNHHNGK